MPLMTPDDRYIVVRGRLWRSSNPNLSDEIRQRLVEELMHARRSVRGLKKQGDLAALAEARQRVDDAKRDLGERGPVCWTDGATDYNRHLVKNTPYAVWYEALSADEKHPH